MKIVKLFLVILTLLLVCSTVQSQNFGARLGNAVKKSAENAAVRKAEQKTEQAVSKTIDDATNPNKPNNDKKNDEKKDNPKKAEAKDKTEKNNESKVTKSPEIMYNKSDFVACDEIIFDDNQTGEKTGEFPSRWDLIEGEAEIVKMNGENVIAIKKGCYIRPLMKDIYNYLGDVYTIEFDYRFTMEKKGEEHGDYWLGLTNPNEKWGGNCKFNLNMPGHVNERNWNNNSKKVRYTYDWQTTSDENGSGNREEIIDPGKWVHISISFNKRVMKIYVNENRIANIPNMKSGIGWLAFGYGHGDDYRHGYIKNFRIAISR
jgi:hypothetical protein